MQPEARLSRAIIKALKGRGAYAYKVHGGPTQPAGLPDICCVYLGYSVWFESKMPGNVPSAIQLERHRQIRAAKGIVKVVYSVAEALAVIDRIDTLVARRKSAQRRSEGP